jgi:hypothetical protein
MAEYQITQVMGETEAEIVGSISWTPEGWDYKTTDGEVERFLSAIKAEGVVTGYSSITQGGAEYSFVEREVKEADPDFVGQLSDMMVRLTFGPGVPSTFIEPKSVRRG